MKTSDRLNAMDVRLAKIELLLTNHLKHTERYIYILSSAVASVGVGYALSFIK